jgi:hypothetical protein
MASTRRSALAANGPNGRSRHGSRPSAPSARERPHQERRRSGREDDTRLTHLTLSCGESARPGFARMVPMFALTMGAARRPLPRRPDPHNAGDRPLGKARDKHGLISWRCERRVEAQLSEGQSARLNHKWGAVGKCFVWVCGAAGHAFTENPLRDPRHAAPG